MNKKLIECVPNFSEGRDLNIIKKITDTIESVQGIRLLHVDRGHGANRTVVTFVGEPENVVEAAFQAIKRASELIDMRKPLQGFAVKGGELQIMFNGKILSCSYFV